MVDSKWIIISLGLACSPFLATTDLARTTGAAQWSYWRQSWRRLWRGEHGPAGDLSWLSGLQSRHPLEPCVPPQSMQTTPNWQHSAPGFMHYALWIVHQIIARAILKCTDPPICPEENVPGNCCCPTHVSSKKLPGKITRVLRMTKSQFCHCSRKVIFALCQKYLLFNALSQTSRSSDYFLIAWYRCFCYGVTSVIINNHDDHHYWFAFMH